MKRVLFLSYYFPPHLVPESLLAVRTVKALVRAGWDMTVLTNRESVPWTKKDQALLGSLPPLPIERAGGLERIAAMLRLHKPLCALGLPEPQFLWTGAAVAAGKRLALARSFDLIHSWASCHASNVAGLRLKRITGLPWIPHFSDPWVDNAYARPNRRQARRIRDLEEAVIREADAVVFTTPETVDLVMRKYPPEWRRKALVVPHGYESDAGSPGIPEAAPRPAGRMRLVYTGGFYGDRTPDGFLNALVLLRERGLPLADFDVTFVGPAEARHREPALRLGLEGVVAFTGLLPLAEARQWAASADVLLVIDAPSKGESVFLPSKLVDYLAFGKPILGVTPPRGASANLLRELGCPIAAPDNPGEIASALAALHAQWKAGALGVSAAFQPVAARYHIDETTRLLAEGFDRVLTVRPALAAGEPAGTGM